MGTKFNWGRALYATGSNLQDYFTRKQAEEQRAKEIADSNAEWERRFMGQQAAIGARRAEDRASELADWERDHVTVNTGIGLPFSSVPLQAEVKRSDLAKRFLDPQVTWGDTYEQEIDGQLHRFQKSNLGQERKVASGPSPNSWGMWPFGTPGVNDVNNLLEYVGGVDPGEKSDNIIPGSLYTPQMDSRGAAFDAADVMGRWRSKVQEMIAAGRSPKDPRFSGDAWEAIRGDRLAEINEAAMPIYEDLELAIQEEHSDNFNPVTGKYGYGGFFGYGDKEATQIEFFDKDRPGYDAFKKIFLERTKKDESNIGLDAVQVAAFKEHAKRKSIDLGELIDDVAGLSDVEREIAKIEFEDGVDIVSYRVAGNEVIGFDQEGNPYKASK